MKAYTLNDTLDAVDTAVLEFVGIIELLAEATESEALWCLIMALTDARVDWAHRNDTTPDMESNQ